MMPLRTTDRRAIDTRDHAGQSNGMLIPIFNVHDTLTSGPTAVQQVYVTTVLPGTSKGPHLHKIRSGWFTCVKGDLKIVVKVGSGYEEYFSGDRHAFRSIEVPAGVPALLVNVGTDTAYVINMPSPAWTPSMNDEHSEDFSDYLAR
jgi:dTDP-4-dehydrorhamnose 3,5-epimerase-like enzyme